MAGFSEDDIQKVRASSDLLSVMGERVAVKQRGRDFWCCCPLHNEKTPSLRIDTDLQLWHCFGCGEGGDVFSFIMKTEDLSFPEAVRRLAERAHIELSEEGGGRRVTSNAKLRLKQVCKAASDYYHVQLMRNPSPEANAAREYLSTRKLGGSVPRLWHLGYAPGRGNLVRHLASAGFTSDEMMSANVAVAGKGQKLRDRFYNRIMFPIFDPQGDCIAFGGRVVGKGEPKYLNTQETPLFHKSQVLYGLDKAKSAMAASGVAVVTEGYTDVIALHEAGIKNTVATLGTALTLRHIRLISRHAQHRIVYLFDGDAAGQRAADRALAFIDESMTPEAGRTKTELCAVMLPDNMDPADYVARFDGAALQDLIDKAQPLLSYGIERRLTQYDLTKAEGRSLALRETLSILAPIKNSLLARDYAIQIASRCRAREEDVLTQLEKLQAPRNGEDLNDAGPTRVSHHVSSLPVKRQQRTQISQAEKNRRRFERQLLTLVIRYPEMGIQYADTLLQTNWHTKAHEHIAEVILSVLEDNPAAEPAQIVTCLGQSIPAAINSITAGMTEAIEDPAKLAKFLVEELGIGDMEDAIATLKSQMAQSETISPDDYEIIFEAVAGMQQDLTRLKTAHVHL